MKRMLCFAQVLCSAPLCSLLPSMKQHFGTSTTRLSATLCITLHSYAKWQTSAELLFKHQQVKKKHIQILSNRSQADERIDAFTTEPWCLHNNCQFRLMFIWQDSWSIAVTPSELPTCSICECQPYRICAPTAITYIDRQPNVEHPFHLPWPMPVTICRYPAPILWPRQW